MLPKLAKNLKQEVNKSERRRGSMDIWNSLTTLIANPTIQSFFISCGASASWDAVKVILKKAEQNNSFELQVYQVIKETFEAFYMKYDLEFKEEIVMTSFLKAIEEINDFNFYFINKNLISDTMGLDINNQELEEWMKIFIVTCSNPKYQWVYNKLSLSSINTSEKSKFKTWMHKYMSNNFCKIQCNLIDELPPIFDDIDTQLSQECWYDTQVLIWEIVFNAQQHGNAKNCILHIYETSITVIDDGIQFNPLIMRNQFPQYGGSMAINKFMHDFPEISIKSEYAKNHNQFTVDFGFNAFNVNIMSEIIVPDLFSSLGYHQVYQLKHPRGTFRYYYIDIDEIPRKYNNSLFASYSGIIGLFDNLKRNITQLTPDSKIFIYFSDMTQTNYQRIYNQMYEILNTPSLDDMDTNGINIVLVKNDPV